MIYKLLTNNMLVDDSQNVYYQIYKPKDRNVGFIYPVTDKLFTHHGCSLASFKATTGW